MRKRETGDFNSSCGDDCSSFFIAKAFILFAKIYLRFTKDE